jgi:hypothetical protein
MALSPDDKCAHENVNHIATTVRSGEHVRSGAGFETVGKGEFLR